MAFTKYATFESAQVLDLKGSATRVKTASLDKLAEFENYRTEDGYLYARIRAISSRVNKNWDGWPSIELAGSPEIFERHQSSEGFTLSASKDRAYGFSTFLGKPIFVDHHNSDPSKARGVIVDANFHVDDHKTSSLDAYYSSPDVDPEHLPGSWVELLLEVDAKAFPRLAKQIIAGSKDPKKGIDGWSMGCDVEKSVCSICKNAATSPDEFCNHIKLKGAEFEVRDSGRKTGSRRAYENCYGVKFFEISAVFEPADETALSREVRSTVNRTATDWGGPNFNPDDIPHLPEGAGGEEATPEVVTCPQCSTQVPWAGLGSVPECPSCGWWDKGDANGNYLDAQSFGPHPIPETEHPLGPHTGSRHLAENPLPQADMSHAPQQVDTLREEKICPVCGSEMDSEQCDVCSYVEPPDPFQNPDLQKAQEADLRMDDSDEQDPQGDKELSIPEGDAASLKQNAPTNPGLVAHVTGDMDWDVSIHSKLAGRVNDQETPASPGAGVATEEPTDTVLSDPTMPITSRVRTASEFIAAAGRNKENTMSNRRVAAEPIPGADNQSGRTMDHDETRVDVEGVGGVQEASNEEASQADGQVDVLGVGGVGVTGVEAQKSEDVDQGNEHSKNVEAIPTKTWNGTDGQHDPVSSEPFPASADGVKSSGWVIEALNAEPYPATADSPGGGSAVHGTEPADPVGKAEDRVDVLDAVTSPDNNSGPTTTWSGTDGNGVTKQQDPTTPESISQGESGMHNSHIFSAFKLADLEIELGLLDADKKYERAAELENTDPAVVQASLQYAQRVKRANVRKAHRLPVLGRSSAVEPVTEPDAPQGEELPDHFALGA